MAQDVVVVERGGARRVGRIVEELSSKSWTVRWPDGSESFAESGANFVKVPEGSLRHLRAADPARLRGLLTEDPVRLALLVLVDQSSPIPGTRLKKEIESAIDQVLKQAKFDRILKEVEQVPGAVRESKGWRFKGDPPYLVQHAATDSEPDARTDPEVVPDQDPGLDLQPEPGPDQASKSALPPLESHEPVADAALSPTLPVLERKLRGDLVPAADYRAWVVAPSSLAELLAVSGEPAIAKGRAMRAFRDLLVDHLEAGRPELAWESAAQLLRAPAVKSSVKVSDAVFAALAPSERLAAVRGSDARTIAWLAELPWLEGVDDSLRVRLTRRLVDAFAPEPLPRSVWKGLTAHDLTQFGSGHLRVALRAAPAFEEVVVPIAQDAFGKVASRRQLFSLLSGDPLIIEAAGAERITEAIRRVAGNDSGVAGLVEQLSEAAALADAKSELAAARQELKKAVAHTEMLADRAAKLEEEIARLRDTLGAYSRQQNSLTESEQRQLVVDGARMAAQVAAMMATIEDADGIPGAITRAGALLARHSIEAVAQRGETVPFDPILHDAPGQRPEEGDLVNVGRPGYVLIDGERSIVLVRALVATVKGE